MVRADVSTDLGRAVELGGAGNPVREVSVSDALLVWFV